MFLFSVININTLHYKLSQISNNLIERTKVNTLYKTDGV
jgi:hypothetical protein